MSSINTILNNVNYVDFNSLHDVAHGTYNMGEVDAVVNDKTGKLTFARINNHVSKTDQNKEVRSKEENQRTNAAVFKAILERYGARDGEGAVNSILSGGIGDFGRISNPYIKEAFKFLMAGDGGRPLSRDELRMLLEMLDSWETSGSLANDRQDPAGVANNEVSRNIERLNDLHAVKIGTKGINDIDDTVRNSIQGLRVANLGTDKGNALLQVSRNQRANTSISEYRAFAKTNYQEDVAQILSDGNLKDDAPVYFADKTRGSLVCGETDRTRGLSPKQLAQETAAMREGLLKFAKSELSQVRGGAKTVKLIERLLLGASWQNDHKILSTPLTKRDLETISTLVADAKSGNNVYVDVEAKILPKRFELPLEQQLDLELRMTEIEEEWNRENPHNLYDGQRIWALCRNEEYTRNAAILYGDKIEPLCRTRQTPPTLRGDAEVTPPGFQVRTGSASHVLRDCQDEFQDGATAVWVNGDGSNHGGYNSVGNGQEEDVMCSSSPRIQAAFVGLGLTKPDELQSNLIKFARNEVGLVKTPATDGILSETTIDNIDQEKCETPFKAIFIDFAMPSLTMSASSTDLSGSVQWQRDCRGLKSDVSAMLPDEQATTQRDVANSRRLLDRYSLLACNKSWDIKDPDEYTKAVEEMTKLKAEVGISNDDLNRAGLEKKTLPNGNMVTFAMDIQMCLVFASEELRAKGVDVHAANTDEQLKNLLTLFKSGDYKDILDAANKNYEATVTRKIDKAFAELESRGIKRLVVSAPGCGFFDNDDGVVAKIFAKAAHAHHVDLVYASFRGEASDVHVKSWKEVFANPPEGTVGVEVYAPADIGVEKGGQNIGAAVKEALKKVKTGYRRDGYAVAINACSRKLAALRTADSQLKKEYLEFLKQARELLATAPVADMRKALEDLLENPNLALVRNEVRNALDMADEFVKPAEEAREAERQLELQRQQKAAEKLAEELKGAGTLQVYAADQLGVDSQLDDGKLGLGLWSKLDELEENSVKNPLLEELRQGGRITNVRGGCVYVLNACSRRLKAFGADAAAAKTNYLKFLEEAKGVLEASGTDEEIRASIKQLRTYKALDDKIRDAVDEALAAVDAYLKEISASV